MGMGDPDSDGRVDWVQLYHQYSSSFPTQQQDDQVPRSMSSASTVVADSPTVISTSPTAPAALQPVERRVGKPGRRRARASRKAPTTLVNTDTSNFRALVQQYTGVPPTPPPVVYHQPTTGSTTTAEQLQGGFLQRLPPDYSIPMQFEVSPPTPLHRPFYPPHQDQHAATSFLQGYGNNDNNMSTGGNERGGDVGSSGGFDRYPM